MVKEFSIILNTLVWYVLGVASTIKGKIDIFLMVFELTLLKIC